MTSGDAKPKSLTEQIVERGGTYKHERHGTVEVIGIWRGIHRVDQAHTTDESDTIIVCYLTEEGAELTDTVDQFIDAVR